MVTDADDVTNGVHAPAVRPIDRRSVRSCREESRFLLGTRLARVTLERDFPRSLLPGKTISRAPVQSASAATPCPAIVNTPSSLERLL